MSQTFKTTSTFHKSLSMMYNKKSSQSNHCIVVIDVFLFLKNVIGKYGATRSPS